MPCTPPWARTVWLQRGLLGRRSFPASGRPGPRGDRGKEREVTAQPWARSPGREGSTPSAPARLEKQLGGSFTVGSLGHVSSNPFLFSFADSSSTHTRLLESPAGRLHLPGDASCAQCWIASAAGLLGHRCLLYPVPPATNPSNVSSLEHGASLSRNRARSPSRRRLSAS